MTLIGGDFLTRDCQRPVLRGVLLIRLKLPFFVLQGFLPVIERSEQPRRVLFEIRSGVVLCVEEEGDVPIVSDMGRVVGLRIQCCVMQRERLMLNADRRKGGSGPGIIEDQQSAGRGLPQGEMNFSFVG